MKFKSFSFILFLALISSFLVVNSGTAKTEKPLVFVFQKQKNPGELKSASEKVAKYLSKELAREVEVKVPSDYSASVQALVSKQADFAYSSSLPFLLAKRDGKASLLLAEQRTDPKGKSRTEYDALLVVRDDSPIKNIKDLKLNSRDIRIAFTSPTSTSGYVFAYKRFVDEGILKAGSDPKTAFKSTAFGGSYTKALEEVLAGRADVAAVSYYTVEGEKAKVYLPQEKLDRLRIVARTPGVPSHVISARAGLNPSIKEEVKNALLKMGKEAPELLEDVYGTARFVEVEESNHVMSTAKAVEHIGLPVDKLM